MTRDARGTPSSRRRGVACAGRGSAADGRVRLFPLHSRHSAELAQGRGGLSRTTPDCSASERWPKPPCTCSATPCSSRGSTGQDAAQTLLPHPGADPPTPLLGSARRPRRIDPIRHRVRPDHGDPPAARGPEPTEVSSVGYQPLD